MLIGVVFRVSETHARPRASLLPDAYGPGCVKDSSAEGDLNCGDPAQEVSEGKNIPVWPGDHTILHCFDKDCDCFLPLSKNCA